MGYLDDLLRDTPHSVAPPVAPPAWIVEALENQPAEPTSIPRRLLAAALIASIAVGGVAGLALAGRPPDSAGARSGGPGVAVSPHLAQPAERVLDHE